jgi:hypothetical protein
MTELRELGWISSDDANVIPPLLGISADDGVRLGASTPADRHRVSSSREPDVEGKTSG